MGIPNAIVRVGERLCIQKLAISEMEYLFPEGEELRLSWRIEGGAQHESLIGDFEASLVAGNTELSGSGKNTHRRRIILGSKVSLSVLLSCSLKVYINLLSNFSQLAGVLGLKVQQPSNELLHHLARG